MNKNKFNKIVLISIILLGAYFRLSYIELTKFGGDQGNQFLITKNALDAGSIIKAGNNSHLILKHGPILQYLLSIAMTFSNEPEVGIWFLSLLSIITIYMVFRIGNDFFSTKIGLLASALFAISHVTIAFARSINNEPLSPLFASFFIYAIFGIKNSKSSFYNFILPILLAILILSHFSNLTLIGFLIVFFYLYRDSIKVKYIILGALIAIIIFLPYLIYLVENGFANLKLLSRVFWALSYLSASNHKILDFYGPVSLLKIFAYHYPGQRGGIFDWIMAILFGMGILILIWKVILKSLLLRRRFSSNIREFSNEFIILISLLLPLIIFLFIRTANCVYYSAQLPIIFILISITIFEIYDKFAKVFLGNALIFLLILSQVGININNLEMLITKGHKWLLRDQK